MAGSVVGRLAPGMVLRRWVWILAVLGLALAGAEIPRRATELNLVTAPAVSPDGKAMVFGWLDDIWTAAVTGGEAVRVVADPARDAYPIFSPDGKGIVFSSDRSGAMQVYSIPAGGGEAVRHTWNSEGAELECVSPDGKRAIVRGFRERPGFRGAGLMVVSLDKDERERPLFDAPGDAASWSPDGRRVLFCSGGEQLYRKGYEGSRASHIWEYDLAKGKFEPLVVEPADARFPFWQADGRSFTYLSARTGTLNLWKYDLKSGKSAALTDFHGDGVFARAPSADGSVFIFHRGFALFRLEIGKEAVPLELWTREKVKSAGHFRQKSGGTAGADFTADLKTIVFAAAGDLWLRTAENAAPVRLTETAAAESGVQFSPGGAWLYFLRDDGLEANYFRAKLVGGALAGVRQLTHGGRSKSRLKPSPDGSRLAWVEGTGDIFTSGADGGDVVRAFASWDLPTFDWSPDGKWLAVAAEDRNSNRDIWLAAADGSRPPVDLTRNPAFEGSPRWSPDGRWLVFAARREADGNSRLWKIDLGKDGPGTDADLQRRADRAELLPTGGIEPTRVIWAADSNSLLFQNRQKSDVRLLSVAIADGAVKTLGNARGVPIRTLPDGGLLWRVGQTPAVFAGGKSREFPISLSVRRDRREMAVLAFRRIWRTLGERFYDPAMNGTDWPAMLAKYEPAVAGVRSSRQFDRLVSQLMGELNASHLSFLRTPWGSEKRTPAAEPPTLHPGLIFRDGKADGPLTIARVVDGAPISTLKDAPQAGETVVEISGGPVDGRTPLHRFFQGDAAKSVAFTIRAKSGKERTLEIRSISYARLRQLERERLLKAARQRVEGAGRFAYVPVPDMSLESISAVELEIYRASLSAEGLVLDLRDNGGGREADRLLSFFTQPAHSFTVPRGGPAGYPNARLVHAAWHGPLVVLCNRNTFSNAEIFCHAMKLTGRAPLIGMETAGGVISAVKASIPDAGELQVPFRGWFEIDSGKNLDLNGAKPDFPVALTPADEDAGRDPQLAKALEILAAQVAKAKPLPEPKFRK